MLHIWHEDNYFPTPTGNNKNSATQQFWEFLQSQNVDNKLIGADIRGFNNNIYLKNHIKQVTFNPKDKYIIFLDKVRNNGKVMKIYREVKKITDKHSNVYLADILCFEYFILKFRLLFVWLKPKNCNKLSGFNALESLCKSFIQLQDSQQPWSNDNALVAYYRAKIGRKNINQNYFDKMVNNLSNEEMATFLLSDISSLTADFHIMKTEFGVCWTNSCCHKSDRTKYEPCSIQKYNKTKNVKAQNLYNCTMAKQLITKYG